MIGFCHSYKTAGTSFNTILRRHYGWHHFDSPGFEHRPLTAKDLTRIRWIYPKLQSICGHTIRPYSDLSEACPELRFYTFLRDPVARAISHFTWFLRWKAHAGVFFEDFPQLIKDWAGAEVNRNRQCRQLSRDGKWKSARDNIMLHPFLILRVKHFDTSLFLFRHWAGEPNMDLAYTLKNTGGDRYERLQSEYPDYLQQVRDFQKFLKQDDKIQTVLGEANREDQALVDWADAEVWPDQIRQYPGNLTAEVEDLQKRIHRHPPQPTEPITSRMHRNLLLKPLRPFLLQHRIPEDVQQNPWL